MEIKEQQIAAMRKYVYFTFNWMPDFIDKVWGDDFCLASHLKSKIASYDWNINRFFVELSWDNQNKMMKWILENYNG